MRSRSGRPPRGARSRRRARGPRAGPARRWPGACGSGSGARRRARRGRSSARRSPASTSAAVAADTPCRGRLEYTVATSPLITCGSSPPPLPQPVRPASVGAQQRQEGLGDPCECRRRPRRAIVTSAGIVAERADRRTHGRRRLSRAECGDPRRRAPGHRRSRARDRRLPRRLARPDRGRPRGRSRSSRRAASCRAAGRSSARRARTRSSATTGPSSIRATLELAAASTG